MHRQPARDALRAFGTEPRHGGVPALLAAPVVSPATASSAATTGSNQQSTWWAGLGASARADSIRVCAAGWRARKPALRVIFLSTRGELAEGRLAVDAIRVYLVAVCLERRHIVAAVQLGGRNTAPPQAQQVRCLGIARKSIRASP
ncbi:hypothetical protein PPGU19_085390 (plasmid) [Paraburkholderia sp. PGU19]|nr:hypothetical protein PPGU19_085390 [Paraburkholderia sp. PGU19]